jgi:hypothetical protein
VETALQVKLNTFKTNLVVYNRLALDRQAGLPVVEAPVPQPTTGQGDQLGRYLKNEAKGKMLAMYNKLKNNTEGIKQDAQVVGFGTNWENAVDDDIAKAMKDKDRWISRTIQLEVDFSSYEGMVTTLAMPELNNTRSRYLTVKTWVEETKDEVQDAIQTVEAEDQARGLYTLHTAITLLLEYPQFSGKDSQCYFAFKENVL